MDDIWTSLTTTIGYGRQAASIQEFLNSDKGTAQREKEASAPAGMRVAFLDSLESVMAYPNPPSPGTEGTVVMVRTASGDTTSMMGQVFVKWDDGKFQPTWASHLVRAGSSKKLASNYARRHNASSINDFLRMSSESNDLVHKATKDLWSLQVGDDGDVVIARLFAEDGSPLKV